MAITDNAIVVETIPFEGETWSVSMYSADMSGGETLKAAVTGSTHYVMKLQINCMTTLTVTIGAGETTPGSLDYTYLGPIAFTAAGPNFVLDFTEPMGLPLKGMKLPSATLLGIDASASGGIFVYAEGKTVKD